MSVTPTPRQVALALGGKQEQPVGTVLRDTRDGSRHESVKGVIEGGGYYLLRDVATGRTSILQPSHVGGMFKVDI